ncbi:aminotransferase class V-fold PLP-dependent enzyme [Clostridium sp. CF012]|uniref:aminotransferase class V-fold PLP-dependent enzyme n=1 Tax=Clostridium sp. CF012 TaxID=2843319 RepID=UPI001C0DC67A|nr:aminotransferase class V-fold PLP-dependent enzyme [Clostridium sp. CF012]MBU3146855.1 aminotransferase class V-fold PLP-dependent enzyme [Clostridium sp. CF012]
MNDKINQGQLFDDNLSNEIKEKFYNIDIDPISHEKRIFFDNAGGALRLKTANEIFKKIDELPDCPEHSNRTAKWLLSIQEKAYEDIKTIFNTKSGSLITSLTASMAIFEMTRAIIEDVPGTNVVTTALEHPSAFDSIVTFAKKTGKEVRVAKTNSVTGGVDVNEITKLVDKDTCLLSVIYASNVSGAVLDIESIVKECRKIKPDLYIVCDSVQHAPHGAIDLEKTPVDAINFAPYKFFGPRGFGIGYMSERAAKLPHSKLIAKPEGEWELGSPAPAHFAAISEIVNYVCWIGETFIDSKDRRELYVEGMNRINMHERALMYRLLNGSLNVTGLRNIKGVKVFLDYEDLSTRDFIMAIGFDDLGSKQAVYEYEKRGVVVFERLVASSYSVRMLESFGMGDVVRVSPLHCHTIEDIDKFLKITEELSQLLLVQGIDCKFA